MRTFYILAALFIGMCFEACNIINPKEPIPTYVHIDSFQFVPGNHNIEGSSSHKITCAWVYYNNNPIGVFDLPATVPVITNGNSGLISIIPGITVDGLNGYQSQYPFYAGDSATITSTPGQIITYLPKARYSSAAKFNFIADFENGNDFHSIIGDTGIVRVTDPSMVFEGTGSGYIDLLTPNDSTVSVYQTSYTFPSGQGYIEINYRSNTLFYVGVEVFASDDKIILTSTPDYIIGINPSANWNKMYISLSDMSSKYLSLFPGSRFRLAIKAVVQDGQSSGYVLLDNIKYITY
jgi:hypothetical protein